ncbi:ribonuclease HI [Helicobacter sp. CLO-3]|uniref:ribonuclease HI n=1 Tax=unclassified Helicobacter TaxID=2593540 RepID=UPI0008054A57|nr:MULTISPECIES: ribonuclease HI [unclassified Helicobacter]OBV29794.1 ribonuclease HI [Helicobacter sp. CLO-3]OHU85248.1 ribonuclease HI [Helicobacter sp. CLO-3]
MKQLNIYTDGSSLGNPGAGGYCAILVYKGVEKIVKGAMPDTTNNRMELLAVIAALRILKEPCEIKLYTDSQYVAQGINEWLSGWIRKNFREVKNPDLWREYIKLSEPHKIQAKWVKGHNGDMMNEKCDKIARFEAKQLQDSEQLIERPKSLLD